MAADTGAALVPVLALRRAGAHRISVHAPLALEGRAPEETMSEYLRLVEEHAATAPEQWFWFHRRW